ncbi:penicillin-insensitive murein endopeptidase [Pseudogemmobacter faecipullorum]|uniref:Penicillin-insensitive murein endopeptidase n=1 Tax=Pseudogemmobacter faecipullorum TaxID=2755041 RepID=A0ABS8CPC4_9RHOB|nr:penicillin-insensitive murein endopeptidase [Pseudogemmobacter faecipullorum]MCB5411043.1 penicillin-insensitive murein endopeptidase [Pseudogemmobacter faecipullorum]
MIRFPRFLSILCLALALPVQAGAQSLAKDLFGSHRAPSAQAAMPIGAYSKGCAAGLLKMPENGPHWQAMRLSRNRNWGHPVMVEYLMDLSYAATRIGWGKGLYIGDISQPRGGPMITGHASHQIGLDADIWWLAPSRLDLSVAERESLSSIPMRSADQRSVTRAWSPAARNLLQVAASDPRVDRIFVAASIKLEICKSAKRSDREWLRKLRPVAGHDTHFHVRLKCPSGSGGACETQSPSVEELSKGGDGCDDTLTWWVTDYLNPPKKTGKPAPKDEDLPKKKHPRQFTMADLPAACASVVSSD